MSCGGSSTTRKVLAECRTLLSSSPDSALSILDSLEACIPSMSLDERMHFGLYHRVAKIRNYVVLDGDSSARVVADYFDRHGTANEKMMAYYVLGCAYRDMGDVPMQLESFQKAVEKADTTRADCDYYTMVSIYGHMADLYHRQVLPEEEIHAIEMAGKCARKDNDTLSVLKSTELLIRPYFHLRDTNRVLAIADSALMLYKKFGYDNIAAEVLSAPISIALDYGDNIKAKECLSIYEQESGLFDNHGNIRKGREYYYRNKGRFYENIGELDSAIFFYQRAASASLFESAYKGLLSVYEKKNKPDSIAKYAKLFASANDSSWLSKNSKMVEQMTAMYDYSRHKKQAEESAQRTARAEKTRMRLLLILLGVSMMSGFMYVSHRREMRRKQEDYAKMERDFADSQTALDGLQKDVRLMRFEYEERMSDMRQEEKSLNNEIELLRNSNNQLTEKYDEKEKALAQLRKYVAKETETYRREISAKTEERERLGGEVEKMREKMDKDSALREKDFWNTSIYKYFRDLANKSYLNDKVEKEKWEGLNNAIRKYFPDFYSYINYSHYLNFEQRCVCELIWTGFADADIAVLINGNSKRVSRLKEQINRRLFDCEDAKTLRANIEALMDW